MPEHPDIVIELFAMFAARLSRYGLEPDHPAVGEVVTVMLGAYYAGRGPSASLRAELLDRAATEMDDAELRLKRRGLVPE
jgi:hypothetical protein